MTVKIELHFDPAPSDPKLDTIMGLLGQILQKEGMQMAEIDDLIKAVQDEQTVDESAVALLNTLTGKINTLVQNATDLATLKAQITGVTSDVAAHNQELADAITLNTPSAPPVP